MMDDGCGQTRCGRSRLGRSTRHTSSMYRLAFLSAIQLGTQPARYYPVLISDMRGLSQEVDAA
jgi:hypothetical protein